MTNAMPGAPDARHSAFVSPLPAPPVEDAAASAPHGLLRGFRPNDTLFSSPRTQLHARGVLEAVRRASHDGLADAAQHALDRAAREVGPLPLVGAVPFDSAAAARLWIPRQAVFAAGHARHAGRRQASRPLTPPEPSSPASSARPTIAMEARPSAARYRDNVADALERIAAGKLDKIVLSRSVRLHARIDVAALLEALLAAHADGYTFAIDLADDPAQPASLVGASPELLLRRQGLQVVSNPLAGSIPRSPDPDEDAGRARALLASTKDRHEHALVADAVAEALAPYCRRLHVPDEPSLRATPTMWHLSSRVEGTLRDPRMGSLALALALHPTPAVCGHPTAAARAAIRELEGYDRGLFTGLVGWCDLEGNGEWAVTLRCAVVEAESATAYAGAGIVAGSQPQAELDETTAKLRTILVAMGLAPAMEARALPREYIA